MKVYQCREKIVLSVGPKSVLRVKTGAVLEQLAFLGVKRPLLQILAPGATLLRGALLPRNLSHLSAPLAIHIQGTQLDAFHLDDPRELQHYYRQALSSAYLKMATILHQVDTNRLIFQLVELANRLGQERQDHWVDLPMCLTIEEWAESVGTSPASAASILRSLRERRLLSIENELLSIDLINLASMMP